MNMLLPLLFLVAAAQGATITVFDIQQGDSPLPENDPDATYKVLGTNSNGVTTILEQVQVAEVVGVATVSGSVVPITVSTSLVVEETYIVSSGGFAKYQAVTADVGEINFLAACTYDPQRVRGQCVGEAWAATGGPTQTTEYGGSVVPLHILTVDESGASSIVESSSSATFPPTSSPASSTVTATSESALASTPAGDADNALSLADLTQTMAALTLGLFSVACILLYV